MLFSSAADGPCLALPPRLLTLTAQLQPFSFAAAFFHLGLFFRRDYTVVYKGHGFFKKLLLSFLWDLFFTTFFLGTVFPPFFNFLFYWLSRCRPIDQTSGIATEIYDACLTYRVDSLFFSLALHS